jgi:hypothetical protein
MAAKIHQNTSGFLKYVSKIPGGGYLKNRWKRIWRIESLESNGKSDLGLEDDNSSDEESDNEESDNEESDNEESDNEL